MRLVQTRNKRLVFGILFSALIVGIMLTIGQVPLAVSQPVTIPVKAIKGAIPMDGANPIWEGVPGVIIPLSGQTITTPMHPNISVKSVFVKAVSNGKDLGLRLDWSDQTKNDTAIGPQDFRDQVLSDLGITEKMKQIALDLSSRLVVTYAHPDTLIPPEKLSISAARPGLTVRARTRVPGR